MTLSETLLRRWPHHWRETLRTRLTCPLHRLLEGHAVDRKQRIAIVRAQPSTGGMAYTRIPHYTLEYIRRYASEHWHGNAEKVSTSPIQSLHVRNVEITSRYCKADEFEIMLVAICKLPEHKIHYVKSI